jgi:signal peptidase II
MAEKDESDAGRDETRRRKAPVRDEIEDAQAAPSPAAMKPDYVFLAWTTIVFLVADLGTKEWATITLTDRRDPIVVIPGLLQLQLAHNRGGAWSLLADQPDGVRLPFFFAVSAAAAIFIFSLYRKLEPHQKALKWALPLVLGGALGNLVDRVRYEHLVDFIDPYHYWPTFNVADIWIVAGVALMAIDMFTPRPKTARVPVAKETKETEAAEGAPP